LRVSIKHAGSRRKCKKEEEKKERNGDEAKENQNLLGMCSPRKRDPYGTTRSRFHTRGARTGLVACEEKVNGNDH